MAIMCQANSQYTHQTTLRDLPQKAEAHQPRQYIQQVQPIIGICRTLKAVSGIPAQPTKLLLELWVVVRDDAVVELLRCQSEADYGDRTIFFEGVDDVNDNLERQAVKICTSSCGSHLWILMLRV